MSVFVEFGVGLAGFSGVVVAFSRSSGQLVDYDRFRVIQLLVSALTPAFLALLPTILAGFDVTGESMWRFVSAAVSASIVVSAAFAVGSVQAIAPEARASLSPAVWRITLGGNSLCLIWNVLNLLQWPVPISSGPVLATLAWLLFVACLLFFRLLLVRFDYAGKPQG
jgi:hypothetical protein